MKICYYDESGDDGYPNYSSPLFVLTGVYFDYTKWKELHNSILEFRRQIKTTHRFPVGLELHTKQFLLDKNPYRKFNFTPLERITLITEFCRFVGSLDLKIINILINKPRINYQGYRILNTALKYSVQRIENDLDPSNNPDARFMIITDEGRVGMMRRTTREIQKINYIPSQFSQCSYRQEIQSLLEDPLPKDSKESYYIQICDMVAYLVYLYGLITTGSGGFSNRLSRYLSQEKLFEWLDLLKPSFNLDAARADAYGVKIHPLA